MKPITGNLTNQMYPIILNEHYWYWDLNYNDIDFCNGFLLYEDRRTYILHTKPRIVGELDISKILNKQYQKPFKKLH